MSRPNCSVICGKFGNGTQIPEFFMFRFIRPICFYAQICNDCALSESTNNRIEENLVITALLILCVARSATANTTHTFLYTLACIEFLSTAK